MNKYKVIIADQADKDLRGIFEYIAFELLSPDNATPERYSKVLNLKKPFSKECGFYQKSIKKSPPMGNILLISFSAYYNESSFFI